MLLLLQAMLSSQKMLSSPGLTGRPSIAERRRWIAALRNTGPPAFAGGDGQSCITAVLRRALTESLNPYRLQRRKMPAPLQPCQQDQARHRDHDADRKEQRPPRRLGHVTRAGRQIGAPDRGKCG